MNHPHIPNTVSAVSAQYTHDSQAAAFLGLGRFGKTLPNKVTMKAKVSFYPHTENISIERADNPNLMLGGIAPHYERVRHPNARQNWGGLYERPDRVMLRLIVPKVEIDRMGMDEAKSQLLLQAMEAIHTLDYID